MNYSTILSKLGRFWGRDLSSVRKDKGYPNLIKSLDRVMTSSGLAAFGDTRAVANIVHGLAELKQPNKAIMSKVIVANTVLSFATMFEEFEKQAPRVVKDCRTPQDIANTAWAAATLGPPSSSATLEAERATKRALIMLMLHHHLLQFQH